jgi:hypothetical protein
MVLYILTFTFLDSRRDDRNVKVKIYASYMCHIESYVTEVKVG